MSTTERKKAFSLSITVQYQKESFFTELLVLEFVRFSWHRRSWVCGTGGNVKKDGSEFFLLLVLLQYDFRLSTHLRSDMNFILLPFRPVSPIAVIAVELRELSVYSFAPAFMQISGIDFLSIVRPMSFMCQLIGDRSRLREF